MEKTSPEPAFIWSYLAHFGANLWKDAPLVRQDLTQIKARRAGV